jgi:hypothetical protein
MKRFERKLKTQQQKSMKLKYRKQCWRDSLRERERDLSSSMNRHRRRDGGRNSVYGCGYNLVLLVYFWRVRENVL